MSPSGGVTVGTESYTSDPPNISIPDVTAVSSSIDSTTVTYNVDVKRFDGSTEARTVVQTYSKSKSGQDGVPGKVARLNLSSYTTGFDDSTDTSPTPTSVTLTGSAQGYDTPEYQFEKKENGDGAFTAIQTYSTTATGTFTFTTGINAQSKLPVEFRVLVREDNTDTNPTQDSCTVAGVVGGDDGSPAKSVRLTADSQVFKVAKDGTVTPSTITFDATLQNTTAGSATFSASPAVSLVEPTANRATLSYTDFKGTNNTAKNPVTVTATADTSFSDSITVVQLEEGSDALVAVLGNESHTFQADNSGTISDFSGGTTTIQVYEGATALTFKTLSPGDGEFTVSSSASGITQSGFSGNTTTTCTTNAPTAMSADNATITFTITGNRADGTAFSISKVQSFSKSKAGAQGAAAQTIRLSSDAQIFTEAKDGTLSPSQINFTANRQNISNSTTFTSSPTVTLTGSGDTRALTSGSFGSNTAVTVTATANSLSDEITIVRVVEGSDAYTVILTNEAHVLPADNSGTVTSYTGSGTNIVAYKGATELNGKTTFGNPGDGEFKVTSATGSNITVGSIQDGGNPIVINDASNMTADTAKITYTISLENALTITKVQTFSKSKEGPTGDAGPGASGFFTIESSDNLSDTGGDNGLSDAFDVINGGNTWTDGGGRNPLVQGDLIIVIDNDYTTSGGDYPVVSLKAKASADGKVLGTGVQGTAAASSDFLVQSTDYIDGNLVVGGTIAGEALIIHSPFAANQSSITITDNPNPKIEIYDTGTLRVKLGYLL